LDLVVVVLLSLRGSFLTSAIVSFVAVGCLDYYFTKPLFSPLIFDPVDAFAIVLFLITAAVITTLVSRLHVHSEQLAVTNRKLQEQIAEVEHAREQVNLARVNRVMLMGEMTASISHEVNQPLTGILANAGTALRYLARDVPDLQEARRALELVVRDGKRARDVIVRIRGLAKKAPPRRLRLDINDTIREVIALTGRELQTKRVELRTELASDLPLVAADRVQLQQVILNLIVNAVEAMHDSGSGPRELVVGTGGIDSGIFAEVRDSGPGLDSALLDRLFDSFYTTKSEGMGMGLSISRSIVEAHGGRLWATPNNPRGAVFRFTLPVEAGASIDV
jgi:signal transduction histidine kinase